MKKKLAIFDLDGVLIDSKENMKLSWNSLNKKFKLNIKFERYLYNVGLPFEKILKNLGIKDHFKTYQNYYSNISKKNLKKIKLYPGVIKTLKFIKSKNIKIAIVTSKDRIRTNKIIKQNFKNIKFDLISCPVKKFRSKPSPDLILNTMSYLNIDPSDSLYCGDMIYDLETAKRAKITFVLAKYGFIKPKIKSKYYINKFSQIIKHI
ncbi:HAD family hydrolase [Candidatus Pelagibacter sp.]|nr:HAD family hydrolase [Candidatus Pelagibacter sp.]